MKNIVTAAIASLLPEGSLPTEIVYLPEGDHEITPFVNGKPQKITVRVLSAKGAQIAASLQADLEKRQAGNVRPWFDFEHKGGASSALPRAFRYVPGKGVMCSLEWTGAGRAAIEGKDFSYFSPTFLMDDDGTPNGLPERGAIGALVNEPAFREIPRIAAVDSCPDTGNPVEVAQRRIDDAARLLVASGEAKSLDDGIVMAIEGNPGLYVEFTDALAKDDVANVKVRKETMREIERMRESLDPSAGDRLQAIAQTILESGKAKDEREARIMAIEQRPDLYQAWLDESTETLNDTKRNKGSVVALDAALHPGVSPALLSEIEAEASKLIASQDAADANSGVIMAFDRNPELYRRYLGSLRTGSATIAAAAPAAASTVSGNVCGRIIAAAKRLLLCGEAKDASEATVMALDADPALYRQYLSEGAPALGAIE